MKQTISAIKQLLHQSPALRKGIILLWHTAGVYLTYYLAFLLRFDGQIPETYMPAFSATILPLLAQLGAALFAPEFSPEASADAVQNLLSGLRSMGVSQAQIEAEARRLGLPPEILEQIRRR